MNIEIRTKDESISWEELVDLFHEAFQERLDQGLNFTCSFFTPEDLERRSAGNVVLVAIDKDNNFLAGTAFVKIVKDNKGPWAYLSNMAINSNYKRCGIGSKLEERRIEIARTNGCKYVISDTAAGATSSVKWHKKNGFYPFSLRSFGSTNYYSIVFRKQLKHHWLWSNPNCCAMHFALSSAINKLYRNSDGSLTKLGKIFFFFRKG